MNPKNIPENLLDYLRHYDWHELSENRKEELHAWIAEEEYKRLRLAYLGLQAAQPEPALTPRLQTKEAVLAGFRMHKRTRTPQGIWNTRIPAWQAAAAAVLLFVLGFFVKPVREILVPETQVIRVVDTLFIPSPAMAKLTDSSESPAEIRGKIPGEGNKRRKGSAPRYSAMQPASVYDINILSLDDNSAMNHGGKSSEEDSLIGRFGFVKL